MSVAPKHFHFYFYYMSVAPTNKFSFNFHVYYMSVAPKHLLLILTSTFILKSHLHFSVTVCSILPYCLFTLTFFTLNLAFILIFTLFFSFLFTTCNTVCPVLPYCLSHLTFTLSFSLIFFWQVLPSVQLSLYPVLPLSHGLDQLLEFSLPKRNYRWWLWWCWW